MTCTTHRLRPRMFRVPAALLCTVAVAAWAPVLQADDTFIESDDYREGEEIVEVFLQADDYRVMVEDLERRGQEFDWGWALTPGWEERSAAQAEAAEEETEEKKGFFRRLRGGGGDEPKPEQEPEELAFDLSDVSTVRIPEVENFAGIVQDEELAEIRDAFVLAAEQLGLEVAGTGTPADLELAVAIVDVNREGGGFGVFKIDPFIEMELRLRELGGGERDLLLIRHQKHSETPGGSALETANMLAQFLR